MSSKGIQRKNASNKIERAKDNRPLVQSTALERGAFTQYHNMVHMNYD